MNKKSCLAIALVLMAVLTGCSKKKHKKVPKKNNKETPVLNMPVNRYAHHASGNFDEDVKAFVLEDTSVPFTSTKGALLAHNQTPNELFWQEAPKDDKSTIYFDYDSSCLKADQKKTLEKSVAAMKEQIKQGKTVVLKGHACRAGHAGASYNLALSDKRAQQAAKLYAQAGIPKNYIKVFGVGYEEPVVIENHPTKEGQAPNRRVEIYSVAV